MIKKLRKKFVTVTMFLMMVTFGIFFIIDNLALAYWEEQETLHSLEWYAQSNSFFEFVPPGEELPEEYSSPVFAIELDKQLNIQNIQSSSKTNQKAPSEQVIASIFSRPANLHKWKSYLYIISEKPYGYLLVITNKSDGKNEILRFLGDIFLISAVFFSLLAVSLLLSRFVTQPAWNALEREKQFISDASHELKTPLAAISINAQALQADLADNRHLLNILSETKRMDDLIQKLLRLSYMEENGSRIEKQPFSLSQCCEEMALSMESIAFEKEITFLYEIEEDITYCGNKSDMKQVIAILLDNAIKHTPKSGTVSFVLENGNSAPVITVKNSGQGIPPEDLPHIFERFYRIDKSRNNDSSSYGLGLAIAKAILDSHNASITAESEYTKDVCFTIKL